MAGHDNGDSFFSDDDLDQLPDDALEELERNAIQFTQAAAPAQTQVSSKYGDEFEDEDLDDTVVVDEARSVPAAISVYGRGNHGYMTQREDFRQQRYGTTSTFASRPPDRLPPIPGPSHGSYSPMPIHLSQRTSIAPSQPSLSIEQAQLKDQHESVNVQQGSLVAASGPDSNMESLQIQIQELLQERNALKQALNAKAGEIAIVRSKQEKTTKEHERELITTKKLHAEQLAKQQKAVEAARHAQKSAVTERDFMKQDLVEESERVRRLNKAREVERSGMGATITTPKKKKLPHSDGFDDGEIEFVSPSKMSPSKFQKRLAGSPSKPSAKRKRKSVESPAALELVETDDPDRGLAESKLPVLDDAVIERLSRRDDRIDFLAMIIDHRPKRDHLPTLEAFSKYALPSSPKESFATIVFSKIPAMGLRSPSDLPLEFCELLISIWSRCMKEKYYIPVYLFIDLLTFALELKTLLLAPHVIDSLVPLAQLTADLVAIPRFNSKSPEPYDRDIDVSTCLALLQLAGLGCMADTEHVSRFWKLMRWDFVLLMLSQNQPNADFDLMVQLLSTSVLETSFGTIASDEESQSINVGYIIDRLTWPLFEIPCLPRSSERLDMASLIDLRLHIIQLLGSMTRSQYSANALTQHQSAIGRIVSMMSEVTDTLYDFSDVHEQSARLLSLATHLLHYLITQFEVNMQRKLSMINGGFQKYLLCLSRLNFSEEDLVLEAGIDSDVAQCALEMLENAVTPDEGTAIQAAFLA